MSSMTDLFPAGEEGSPRRPAGLATSDAGQPRRALPEVPYLKRWRQVQSAPSWVWHALIALFAFALRMVGLRQPESLVFDESYYVKQAWSMRLTGVELRVDQALGEKANDLFASGDPGVFTSSGDLVVHPPVGKWLIALGQMAMGVENPASWRIAAVIAGSLMVFILARLTTRLTGNAWWGALAGALMAFESTSFVISRTGILDVFVGLFALLTLWFVAIDRDQVRARLAQVEEPGLHGPLLRHPWLWAAGTSLGLMTATKWSGLYLMAVIGLLVVVVDAADRKRIGVIRWHVGELPTAVLAFVQLVVVPALIYVVSWAGWFSSSLGYGRDWAKDNPATGLVVVVPDSLRSWWHYQVEIFNLSTTMNSPHPYATRPLTWMLQDRPTLFFQRTTIEGNGTCPSGVEQCIETVTSLGTVPLWWAGFVAMLACLSLAVAGPQVMKRWSWAGTLAFAGMAGLYLFWFTVGDRTIYSFYTGAFSAVMILCVVVCLSAIRGRGDDPRRAAIAMWSGVVLLMVTIVWFVWFYPVLTGDMLPLADWRQRMELWEHWTKAPASGS